jgi:hypothetical protein
LIGCAQPGRKRHRRGDYKLGNCRPHRDSLYSSVSIAITARALDQWSALRRQDRMATEWGCIGGFGLVIRGEPVALGRVVARGPRLLHPRRESGRLTVRGPLCEWSGNGKTNWPVWVATGPSIRARRCAPGFGRWANGEAGSRLILNSSPALSRSFGAGVDVSANVALSNSSRKRGLESRPKTG